MVISRVVKIWILLCITGSFFVVELAVGYIVGSLALIADAYHMLNDTISLVIALYAIQLSKRSANGKYTYGWHRAEVIAALVNGVFLLALCFSIFLESLSRFAHPPEIQDPRLVVIVGSVGLACNIFGLLLFHEHGHGHSHDHSGSSHRDKQLASDDHPASPRSGTENEPIPRRSGSIHSVYGLPAQNRVAMNEAARVFHAMYWTGYDGELDRQERGEDEITVASPPVAPPSQELQANRAPTPAPHSHSHSHDHGSSSDGALNLRAVFLHVAADALGSLGVVVSGLIIWFAKSQARFYADPTLSVAITILIMCTAVPLVRSAGFILLQGVPSYISLSELRKKIAEVDGVESAHELHVWQLSEARLIASVHIKVSSTRPYMDITRDVKSVLHQSGIHSGTVQPEFADDGSDTKASGLHDIGSKTDWNWAPLSAR